MALLDLMINSWIIIFIIAIISIIINVILGVKVYLQKEELDRLRGGRLSREELEILRARLARIKKLSK
ncbi:MAG: hypothetical protein APG08_00425 [Candidatus Methanofastidiosum methylothiophilum]|jgi:hypothetical protein|uniref:Uncharacterized protein n=1 Tax=Candidatus Methanofastidiosum methylothiophilum TaxID=1705564 RepID=A0A150JDJ8_9EURY|nr:MAG: hypothetical protein AN188_00277 [Candidatus Methanofastidiosum methylthiophilus]KYC57141.1 MAG: hypothetical protein APG08_00425 [Candidatus Methanofastidiosum methylthiophilus]KYC57897.1 MAG: hypothetical protein APG09_00784 [Candidatus Methanofastidiosum methylthiophilus]OQC52558.1 MAG: hypothetical protein BWX56_00278 [Euryarchaeota archaeon ADurb.Bin023]HPC80935.1 hypothetical protein [Methanofastidiosum sp.]